MYCKAKKNFGAIRKILKIFIFENLLQKNVQKVGFQFMLILVLLGMYFDAAVVFVTKSSLLFRLAVTILCPPPFGFSDLPLALNSSYDA